MLSRLSLDAVDGEGMLHLVRDVLGRLLRNENLAIRVDAVVAGDAVLLRLKNRQVELYAGKLAHLLVLHVLATLLASALEHLLRLHLQPGLHCARLRRLLGVGVFLHVVVRLAVP